MEKQEKFKRKGVEYMTRRCILMCSLPMEHVLRCVIETSRRQEEKTENKKGGKKCEICSCGGSGDRIRS